LMMGVVISGERRRQAQALEERAARAATGFEALGVRPGEPIALVLRNDLAFVESSLGAGRIGAYCVPMNWHNTVEEARYVLADSGARVIVVHADLYARLHGAFPSGTSVIVVATPSEIQAAYRLDPAECAATWGCIEWDDWLASHTPRTAPPVPAPDVMLYTSGTTGQPKGVRRAAPTVEQVGQQDKVRALSFGFPQTGCEGLTLVVTGPMYHSAPNAYGLIAARQGATVILQPRFDAEQLLQLIERHRVTHLQMVPVMFNRLLDLPETTRRRYDLGSLRFVVHSAAPIAQEIKRQMIDWWGPIIHEYYGTTETSIITRCSAEEWLAHPGTVGRPHDGAELRILGDNGQSLGAGQPGRICCRVHGVPDFTYHNDDAKRRAAEVDRCILTGDIGFVDKEGYLYLCDRANDMVISGGVNIYPAEIEAALCRMPGVVDCAVFGIPDSEFGEAVHAVVQPVPGHEIDVESVREHLRPMLAGYKLPRSVELRSELPREDSGKIFKRKLRDPWWREVGRRI
jgi:long-chain acyl-CoA synthetase